MIPQATDFQNWLEIESSNKHIELAVSLRSQF